MGRVESAWVEPAATALRATLVAGDLTGRSVLVVGGGPIGQLCCRLARHFGGGACLPERAVRRAPELRRGLRGRPRIRPHVDAADIERLKADAVLECSGAEPGVTAALVAARPEGTIVVVGGARAGLDPLTILIKELRVQG